MSTAGAAVVLVAPGDLIPAAAAPLIHAATAVYATEPGLGFPAPPPEPGGAVVLLTADIDHPAAKTLVAAGASVLRAGGLLEAVAVMDRLRSPGGCPWDAEQTHDSLKQYLVEECYELLDAIETGDRVALREELGDVLLQVLFHARVAKEDAADPFTIDEVAAELVAKLVGRHPHVFAGGDPAVRDASTQQHRWEELKQQEKQRESSVDGVALGQPALALAAKLVQRTKRASFPRDLLPPDDLFAAAARVKLDDGTDPEGALRTTAREFAANVRTAEAAAKGAGITTLDEAAWRRFWPS